MRIKICGITRVQDAQLAAEAGADAIGLNFVTGPRQIDIRQADAILCSLPPMVTPVALVRLSDGQLDRSIGELLDARRVRILQLYGEFDGASVARLQEAGFACIWPFAVRDAGFSAAIDRQLASADPRPAAVLLDTHADSLAGGTGRPWQWQWLAEARAQDLLNGWPPIVLAGGLDPQNVAEAIRAVRPFAVDVATGVESAPGRKDAAKLEAFIRAARQAAE